MLEEVRRRSGQLGLDIVMVNVWEHVNATEEARHFCNIHGLEGTVLIDETNEYCEKSLGISGVPMNLLVDAEGIVREVGATTPAELEDAMQRLLAAES